MHRSLWTVVAGLFFCGNVAIADPIAVSPANHRYLQFEGKPIVLVTSAEHYGAVLNLDFDYVKYLDTLKHDGLNQSRCFSGVYREVPSSFGIRDNTLAPPDGRYSSPWVRTADGKYDLSKWNDAHFARMRDYVAEAGKRGVFIELVLFCPFYKDELWAICPLNAANNTAGVGRKVADRKEVNTLQHKDILEQQLALTRKVVTELNAFDNVYYEIANEPYFGGDDDWQRRIAQEIVATEKSLPKKHLIAQNIANGSKKIENPGPNIGLFNFHYANPPTTIALNAELKRPIAYDETGFKGSGDDVYRVHGWQFMLAGGAGYSHLDYSFTARTPDGTGQISAPGGGGPAIRRQLGMLRRFVENLPLADAQPAADIAKAGNGVKVYALAAGKSYGLSVVRATAEKQKDKNGKDKETGKLIDPAAGKPVTLTLALPPGGYNATWIDTRSGESTQQTIVAEAGKPAAVTSPGFEIDIALRIDAAR